MTFANDLMRDIPESWKKIVRAKALRPALKKVIDDLYPIRQTMTPCVGQVFNAFRHCPFPQGDRPLIVIIGQDPYHKKGVADGLAFSCDTFQSSVRTIFKALANQNLIDKNIPKSSNLMSWAKQGILLLNTALTVEIDKPMSHVAIWRDYITLLIQEIQVQIKNIVFVLWGKHAENIMPLISDNNHILTWGHPSGMNRVNSDPDNPKSFLNCDHFSWINARLKEMGQAEINWRPYEIVDVVLTPNRISVNRVISRHIAKTESKTSAETDLKSGAELLNNLVEQKYDRPPYLRVITNIEYLATTNCADLPISKKIQEMGGTIDTKYCDTWGDPPTCEWEEKYRMWHALKALETKNITDYKK